MIKSTGVTQLLDVVIVVSRVEWPQPLNESERVAPYPQSYVYRFDVEEHDLHRFITACNENSIHNEKLGAVTPAVPKRGWWQNVKDFINRGLLVP